MWSELTSFDCNNILYLIFPSLSLSLSIGVERDVRTPTSPEVIVISDDDDDDVADVGEESLIRSSQPTTSNNVKLGKNNFSFNLKE